MTDIAKVLRQAYLLGQTYWQQADSEYTSQHKKADITQQKFENLTNETVMELTAKQEEMKRLLEMQEKYQELIFAVARKFPGESRHETALRYINQAESNTPSQPAVDAESPLTDVRAILYQCDRGNVSLPWLIDALRGIVERGALAPVELRVIMWDIVTGKPLVFLSDAQVAIAAARKLG